MKFIFDVCPIAKPRMTQRDKWSQREAVTKYFGYRDTIRYKSNISGLRSLPGTIDGLTFALPMPGSWSQKKQNEMRGQPHTQRPDLDNLCKGFCDVWAEDCHIHCIKNMAKVWDDFGSIQLEIEHADTLHHFQETNT